MEPDEYDAALFALAEKLRDVARSAGRPEVVAKAEGIMALTVGGKPARTKSDALLRLLDGLGL